MAITFSASNTTACNSLIGVGIPKLPPFIDLAKSVVETMNTKFKLGLDLIPQARESAVSHLSNTQSQTLLKSISLLLPAEGTNAIAPGAYSGLRLAGLNILLKRANLEINRCLSHAGTFSYRLEIYQTQPQTASKLLPSVGLRDLFSVGIGQAASAGPNRPAMPFIAYAMGSGDNGGGGGKGSGTTDHSAAERIRAALKAKGPELKALADELARGKSREIVERLRALMDASGEKDAESVVAEAVSILTGKK